jgi:methyltransferase
LNVAALTLIAVLLMMAGEAALSAFNERVLLARGFSRGADAQLLAAMRWAYPSCFVLMALEGAWFGPSSPDALGAGLVLFGLSKALKLWTISTLGVRWTFAVLVHPDVPPVTHGPYAFSRHPNYIAVLGELAGMGLIVWAPVTGLLALASYAVLLRRKIAIEDRALGRQ